MHPQRKRDPNRPRIVREHEVEAAASEALASAIGQHASAAVVLTGRTITGTRQEGSRFDITLDSGDIVSFIGDFVVAGTPAKPQIGHSTSQHGPPHDAVIEDEVVEDAEWSEVKEDG